ISKRAIARDMGIAYLTVLRLIKKARDTGKIEDLERSGCPKVLTQEEERRIIELINSGECETATEIYSKFCHETNHQVSVETVRNILRRHGFVSRVKRKCPVLNEAAKQARYEFAKQYEDWT
ncbi:7862_t:CDS:1, partial [Racocetra persica]